MDSAKKEAKSINRFWEKTQVNHETQCIVWTGTKDRAGYGKFGYNYKMVIAHRFAWRITNGEIPDNLFVCHKCDNPSCVNPSHLFLGTHKNNMDDMRQKKRERFLCGELHGCSKSSNKDVCAIRDEYSLGNTSHKRLALKYGLHRTTISRIVRSLTWRCVT